MHEKDAPIHPILEKLRARSGGILTPARLTRIAINALIWVVILGVAAYLDPTGALSSLKKLFIAGSLVAGLVLLIWAADSIVRLIMGKRALDGKMGARLGTALAAIFIIAAIVWLSDLLN